MNSFYHSTRSKLDSVTSKQAILRGIAPDGGLYVADWLGQTKMDLAAVCAQGFHQTARQVLGILLPDYAEDELATCVEAAYGSQWDTPAVTPVTPLGADWLLELYHGPTSAFKDVALQMLPQLMSVARAGDGRDVMIVTATSGDTGKAALDGFAGVPHTGVTVFYPEGKVSDVQHLQMATQAGDNVAVCAIRGNFDDAQSEVKSIFADEALAQRLADTATDPADQTVFICHGDCLDDAEYTAEQIRALVPVKDIIINYVGPVIGAHTGPGVISIFFVGTHR